jgi:putative PIN family toxin of toxin-antitoxin system
VTYLGQRFVVDTNVLVSRLLLPDSMPGQAFAKAQRMGDLLVSDDTLSELAEVLSRPKFDKYLPAKERKKFFSLLAPLCIKVEIVQPIQACRDPRDDKFLELAVNGSADFILSGDADLLALHPFQDTPILSPVQYLEKAD